MECTPSRQISFTDMMQTPAERVRRRHICTLHLSGIRTLFRQPFPWDIAPLGILQKCWLSAPPGDLVFIRYPQRAVLIAVGIWASTARSKAEKAQRVPYQALKLTEEQIVEAEETVLAERLRSIAGMHCLVQLVLRVVAGRSDSLGVGMGRLETKMQGDWPVYRRIISQYV
ncbi:hypothetical protein ACJ73_02413 [Blastomyces percursus]|uniref:Uncharacterized protein n=1 Tax=Blastomyces percursus TaxID=1658174 RepID=A0A1J9QBJ2_9EURO|nr:hypothetical protein ACJ73_02413 [Blastomyces percursus]